jgi:hypothetical protein
MVRSCVGSSSWLTTLLKDGDDKIQHWGFGQVHPKYPKVFSPITLGPIELRNRFYSSPHAVPMTIGSKPSDDYIHYNVARVKGGCSLIILSMTAHGRGRSFQPSRKVPQLFTIGDALAPRMWAAASFEGHKFARYIGEPNAPQSVADVYFSDDDPSLAPIPGDMERAHARRSP